MNKNLPSNDKNDICDFLEYQTFLNGEMGIDEYYYSSEEDDNENTQPNEIINMLKRRLNLYSPYTPFKITKNKLVSEFKTIESKQNNLHYLFCLHYSLYGAEKVTREESTLFENIVDIALRKYLNTNSSVLTSFGDTEYSIKVKIHNLLDATKEKIGDLSLMPPHAKDGGIDIITYKPFDERGNQMIILTDATLSKNWSLKKVAIKIRHWEQYIHFKVNPLTCLAIARMIPEERFHYASRENGLLFDRARITGLYVPNTQITQSLTNWKEQKCVS